MFNLSVGVKTGYKLRDINVPVIIRDKRGILFYSTEDLLPRVTQFNLPPGSYMVDSGLFSPIAFPVAFPLLKLPKPNRVMNRNPSNFKILFGVNKAKCTVDWNRGTILFDNSFKERPLPQIDFILGHEFGHRYYGGFNQKAQPSQYEQAERSCDMFAANRMLKMGYNPSQVGDSPNDSLSDNADGRKILMIQNLAKLRL